MSEEFDIEELLREHLIDASEPSPPGLFADIEARIDGEERRKRRFFIWFWFGAGLVIITSAILLFVFNGNAADNTSIVVNNTITDTTQINSKEGGLFLPSTESLHEATNTNTIDSASTNNLHLEDADHALNSTDSEHINPNQISTENRSGLSQTEVASINPNETDKIKEKTELSGTTDLAEGVTSSGQREIENELNESQSKNGLSQLSLNPESDSLTKSGNAETERLDNNYAKTTVNSETQHADANSLGTGISNPTNATVKNDTTRSENKSVTNLNPSDEIVSQDSIPSSLSNIKTKSDTTALADQLLQDSILLPPTIESPSNDSTATTKDDKKRFGLIANMGYLAFEEAVFKPYFTSGVMSPYDFRASGFELGVGAYYRVKNRFEFSLIGSYGQRYSSFTYDLMISENDYFESYKNDTDIPLENLDDPNTCNCFLAQDASLDYSITTISLSLGAAYDLIQRPKFNFGPQLEFGTIGNTKYTTRQSSVISFSPELTEQFIGLTVGAGLNFNYQLSPKIQLGIAPRYRFQFVGSSSIYANDIQQVFIPLQLKFRL